VYSAATIAAAPLTISLSADSAAADILSAPVVQPKPVAFGEFKAGLSPNEQAVEFQRNSIRTLPRQGERYVQSECAPESLRMLQLDHKQLERL
jgi:hypothetical protein